MPGSVVTHEHEFAEILEVKVYFVVSWTSRKKKKNSLGNLNFSAYAYLKVGYSSHLSMGGGGGGVGDGRRGEWGWADSSFNFILAPRVGDKSLAWEEREGYRRGHMLKKRRLGQVRKSPFETLKYWLSSVNDNTEFCLSGVSTRGGHPLIFSKFANR